VTVWEVGKLPRADKEKTPREAPSVSLEAELTASKDAQMLDLGGKKPEQFARLIQRGSLPPRQKVDLLLTIRNTSNRTLTLEPHLGFEFHLVGAGAMNHPEIPRQTGVGPEDGSERPKPVVLEPEGSYSVSINTLDNYDDCRRTYWLLPGKYTIHA